MSNECTITNTDTLQKKSDNSGRETGGGGTDEDLEKAVPNIDPSSSPQIKSNDAASSNSSKDDEQ